MQLNNKLVVGVLLFNSFYCANSFAQSSSEATVPKLEIGDTWSYQFTDEWKKEIRSELAIKSVVHTSNKWIWYEGKDYDNKPQLTRTDLSMNPASYTYRGESQSRKEYVWPLSVGKKWSNNLKRESGENYVEQREDCEVESFEKVKVPAGEFDAFKIYCSLKDSWANGIYNTGKKYHWYSSVTKSYVKTQTEWRTPFGLYSQSLVELKSFTVK